MTDAERARLQAFAVARGAASAALAFVVFAASAAVVWKLVDPGFAARGQLFILLPLAAWWAWLFRKAPGDVLAARRDLAEDGMAAVEGEARVRTRAGVGVIAFGSSRLLVNGRAFSIDAALADEIVEGARVRVRHGARSGALASVERVGPPPAAAPVDAPAPLEPLSEREVAILRLMAEGLSDKEIARDLALSPGTVRTYNTAIYAKLDAKRRTEAVARARALGLLDGGSAPT